MASVRSHNTVRGRVSALRPVWLLYAVLAAGVLLGSVFEMSKGTFFFGWFLFFLVPMSTVACAPFGFFVGVLAQYRVWYTQRYSWRFVGVATALMFVIMLVGWGSLIVAHFDPMYVLAVVWPTVTSALFMILGMYLVRCNEYVESAYDAGVDMDEDDVYDAYGNYIPTGNPDDYDAYGNYIARDRYDADDGAYDSDDLAYEADDEYEDIDDEVDDELEDEADDSGDDGDDGDDDEADAELEDEADDGLEYETYDEPGDDVADTGLDENNE